MRAPLRSFNLRVVQSVLETKRIAALRQFVVDPDDSRAHALTPSLSSLCPSSKWRAQYACRDCQRDTPNCSERYPRRHSEWTRVRPYLLEILEEMYPKTSEEPLSLSARYR